MSADTQGTRRAALALHCLTDDDAAWVLERLRENDRQAVLPLLAELKALGIPPSRELLSGVRECLPQHGEDSDLALLRAADASNIAMLLDQEPLALTALLLRCEAWPWQRQFMEGLSPSKRMHLADLMRESQAIPPRLRETLLTTLAHKLAAIAPGYEATLSTLERRTRNFIGRWLDRWNRGTA